MYYGADDGAYLCLCSSDSLLGGDLTLIAYFVGVVLRDRDSGLMSRPVALRKS